MFDMNKGVFIAIDGIDGAGNTTHSKLLVEWLKNRGFKAYLTKEPNPKSPIGSLIRRYLKGTMIHPAIDALLFAADRVEHYMNYILPELEKGKIVVSDRYVESSIAYQSAQGLPMSWVIKINRYAPKPNLTIILDIEPEVSLKRKKGDKERFENPSFLAKVRRNLLIRANLMGYPVLYSGFDVEEVHRALVSIVEKYLKQIGLL